MIGHFSVALAFVARWEGIFSDDARDLGGATKYGITHAVLSQWRGSQRLQRGRSGADPRRSRGDLPQELLGCLPLR